MMNTGAMLAILTTITLDDYYTDQIQEKRQKMKNYAGSMKSIGDNVRLWGGSITDTLRNSGRTDLEQSILQGAQELPIYIFAQVIRRQADCKVLCRSMRKPLHFCRIPTWKTPCVPCGKTASCCVS